MTRGIGSSCKPVGSPLAAVSQRRKGGSARPDARDPGPDQPPAQQAPDRGAEREGRPRRAAPGAAAAYGRLDVAFANAGIRPGVGFVGFPNGSEQRRVEEGALERYSDERWNRVIEINLSGVFATVRAAARHMRPRRSGRIIITTSVATTVVRTAVGSAYLAAKAGARHFMHSIALELAAYWITANAIAPGVFATNIGGGRTLDADVQAATASVIPMHRVGQSDDIKALALFLASLASEYITGQEIVIDGGMALGFAD
jgi:NAD(P)-dependent dehydrogenase (short-subunit alcohol dehydrogenase family)